MKAKVLLPIGFLLLISSCEPFYYMPMTHMVPVHKDKGELLTQASFGDELAFHAAYSITKNWSVMGGVGKFSHTSEADEFSDKIVSKITNLEVGGGYFINYGKHGHLELYALAGKGSSRSSVGGIAEPDLTYHRISLQPVFAQHFEVVDVYFSPRVSFVKYLDGPYVNSSTFGPISYSLQDELNNGSGRYIAEPLIGVRIGNSKIKGMIQVCFPIVINDNEGYFQTYVYPQNIALGATYLFNLKR